MADQARTSAPTSAPTDAPGGTPAGTSGGPTWTRARLVRVLRLCFGSTPAGGVDTTAVAAAMGVSRRSVQRWLNAPHGRSRAPIPAARLAQLVELTQPAALTLRREAQGADYALDAIDKLGLGRGRGVLPSWRERRWLEPHLVVVLEVKVDDQKIRQVLLGRADLGRLDGFRKRGRVVDQTTVPTRFHATVLTHRVLAARQPWRYQARPGQVAASYTQAWLDDAPATHLGRDAQELPPPPP